MHWILSFHLIFMVAWFSGLFYLPRLFLYHAMSHDTTSMARFKVMEKKLFWMIMTPAGILTTVFGIWLFSLDWRYYFYAHWMIVKLVLVILLWGYHHACWRMLRKFNADDNTYSPIFFRWFNEFPTLILIAVVILTVVKPI